MNRFLTFLLFFVLFPFFSHAEHRFALIYPQGEGTPQQAQGLIDQFAAALSKATKETWAGTYVNNAIAGESLLINAKQHSIDWILTTSSFLTLSTNPFLNTLSPSLKAKRVFAKSDKDTYFILKHKYSVRLKKIYYEASLSNNLAIKLTTGTESQARLIAVPLIFSQIKKLALAKSTEEGILLTESMATILKDKLKPDWAREFITTPAVGSIEYPGVYWVNTSDVELKNKTNAALQELNLKLDTRSILEEMRIDSFILY